MLCYGFRDDFVVGFGFGGVCNFVLQILLFLLFSFVSCVLWMLFFFLQVDQVSSNVLGFWFSSGLYRLFVCQGLFFLFGIFYLLFYVGFKVVVFIYMDFLELLFLLVVQRDYFQLKIFLSKFNGQFLGLVWLGFVIGFLGFFVSFMRYMLVKKVFGVGGIMYEILV